MIREKRQHPRARIDKPCSIELGTQTDPALLRDISVGGAFIESTLGVPFGSNVILVVALQGDAPALRLPAVVRWSQPDGFGLQFGLLGARDTHAITQLIKK